jgi:glycosyltransferase involved in cell wall biosynthesis
VDEEYSVNLPRSVHFIEPGGEGGVFQHTVEAARLLALVGTDTVVHTAAGHEEVVAVNGVRFCGCVNWFRGARRGPRRRLMIVASYVFMTLPHLRRETAATVVHVQGLFASPLYALTLGVVRRRRRQRLIFSPHNTFSRAGRAWEEVVLRLASRRLADAVVAFSAADAERISSWGATAVRCPLVQLAPPVSPDRVAAWRARLSAGHDLPVLLVPGQIRSDKGVDIVIRAARLLKTKVRVAVVGEDKGDLARCLRIAEECAVDVSWEVGYHPLDEFAAAIASADAVALAYVQASQSGVLALAAALGTPSVGSPVGGLADYATVTASSTDEAAFAQAIDLLLARANSHVQPQDPTGALLKVYEAPSTASAATQPGPSMAANPRGQ